MRIKVEQKHIDSGCRGNGDKCPIALALKDATGRNMFVGVAIRLHQDNNLGLVGTTTVMDSTDEIRDFINYFDSNLPVEPFEFELPWEG